MSWYFDSSALTKLVATELESGELARVIAAGRWSISASALVRTELARAVMRKDGSVLKLRDLLGEIDLIPVSDAALDLAGRLQPPALRSLDAVHIASAVLLGSSCEGIVSYDVRMQAAARRAGLAVIAPGQGA